MSDLPFALLTRFGLIICVSAETIVTLSGWGLRALKPQGQRNEQSFVCSLVNDKYGNAVEWRMKFGSEFSQNLTNSATAAQVKTAIEFFTNIGNVSVVFEKSGLAFASACDAAGVTIKLTFDTFAGPLQPIEIEMPKHSSAVSATVAKAGFAIVDEVSVSQQHSAQGPKFVVACTCAGACAGSFNLRLGRRVSRKLGVDSPVRTVDEQQPGSATTGAGSSLESVVNNLFRAVAVLSASASGSICQDSATKVTTLDLAPGIHPDFSIETYRVQGTGLTVSLSKPFLGTASVAQCAGRGVCSFASGKCDCATGFESSDLNMQPGRSGDCGSYVGAMACPTAKTGSTCSGHGTCTAAPFFKCQCQQGYFGPDCSSKSCPFGPAWFDATIASADPRPLVECSARGSCNYISGTCSCDAGFAGSACQFTACPVLDNEVCGSRGRCVTVKELAGASTRGLESTAVASRSTRLEVQSISCSLDGSAGQTEFKLAFANHSTAAIPRAASASAVEAALEALPNIADVTVRTASDRLGLAAAAPDSACSASTHFMIVTFGSSLPGNVHELAVSDPARMRAVQLRAGSASDVQQFVCVGASTATFTLAFQGEVTGTMPAGSAAAAPETLARRVQRELELLPSIGSVNVELVSGSSAQGLQPAADFCAASPGNSLLVTFISVVDNYGKLPLLVAAGVSGSPAITAGVVQTGARPSYGVEAPTAPAVWDATRIMGCICDTYTIGNGTQVGDFDELRHSGPACQLNRCPYGIHPKDTYMPGIGNAKALQNEKQGFFCLGQPASSFLVSFRGSRSAAAVSGSATAADLAAAFESLPTIGRVTVTCTAATICTPAGTTCSIEFLTELGDVPSASTIPVNPSAGGLPADTYFWEEQKGTGRPQQCSGRGECKVDQQIGMCKCESDNVTSGGPGKLGARGDCGYQRKHRRARS